MRMEWIGCAKSKKKEKNTHTHEKRPSFLFLFFLVQNISTAPGNVGIWLSSYPITKTHIECSTTEIAMRFMEYNPSATYHITN